MKPDLFPRNPLMLPRPLHAAALFRMQRRNHKLRVSPLRAVLLLLTAPFRSTHPAVLLVAMAAVYLASWALMRVIP